MLMKKIFLLLLVTLIVGLLSQCEPKHVNTSGYYRYNAKGELERPKDYRTWVFAGTGTTPVSVDPMALFPDFQNIYIDPESYRFWKENGFYREGTIFVKELLRRGDTVSPIGKGFFQGNHYSLSATIKDTIRFPDVPGGWQYFKFTNYEAMNLNPSSPALGAACYTCHSHTAKGYGPFTELYPILLDARNYGKDNPENRNTRKGLDEDMKRFKE